MAVTLTQFLDQIHPTWLIRAQPYVNSLGPKIWLADGVMQQEILVEPFPEVQLRFWGGQIESMSCTCDTEDPICEHLVAACLVLQSAEEDDK